MSAIGVTVGVASTAVAPLNTSRKRLTLVNSGTFPVDLMPTAAATLGKGIRLNPHGGAWSTPYPAAVNAICANAGAKVSGFDV